MDTDEHTERYLGFLRQLLKPLSIADSAEFLFPKFRQLGLDIACKHFAIIIDTSFLMLDRWPPWFDELIRLKEPIGCLLVVPTLVSKELARHMDNDEKKLKASVGRKRLVDLIDIGCEEPSLQDVQIDFQSDDLGADSHVDRSLIAYALELASKPDIGVAFVATDDGGIMMDIVRLGKKHGERCIRTISKETLRETVEETIKEVIFIPVARNSPEFIASMST